MYLAHSGDNKHLITALESGGSVSDKML